MGELYKKYFSLFDKFFDEAIVTKKCFRLQDCFFVVNKKTIQKGGCGCCGSKYNNIYLEGNYIHVGGDSGEFDAHVKSYYLGCKQFSQDDEDDGDKYSYILFKAYFDSLHSEWFEQFLPKKLPILEDVCSMCTIQSL